MIDYFSNFDAVQQFNTAHLGFEEIAIHMSDGISVGVINNHLTSIEALESEITILKNFGSEKDQIEYVQQVAKHYEDLFKIVFSHLYLIALKSLRF